MATDCITQTTFRFQQNSKPVLASFDMAHASSDGGAVLLKAIDATLSLTERCAAAGQGAPSASGAAAPARVRPGVCPSWAQIWAQTQLRENFEAGNLLKRMVGRDGIEPPTPGFSVLCSTN